MLFYGDYVKQTTLLNHILTADHGKRIAVIENEVLCHHNSFIFLHPINLHISYDD